MAVKISPVCKWYDFWVGVFWDRIQKRLYILPLPCLGVRIAFSIETFRVRSDRRPGKFYTCHQFWGFYVLQPEDGGHSFTCVDLSYKGLYKCDEYGELI